MKLSVRQQIQLRPTAPFAFDPTFHKPDHFTTGDNEWQPGIRWQTLLWNGKPLGLKFVNEGNIDNPSITLHIYSNVKLPQKPVDVLAREIRATVLSTINMFSSAYIALIGLAIGWVANYSILYAFLFMGLIVLSGSMFFRINERHVR